ncbi:MAG: MATE family efflux transporter [Oscillospiraceae bacterium]
MSEILFNKARIVREKDFYKMLFSIALPVTMQNLIMFFIQMLDTVMLGELGDVAMSASSLANQPFFIFNMIVFGLAGGASILIAQYWGKKELLPIRRIISMAIDIGILVGAILAVLIYMFPENVMRLFTKDMAVINAGVDYLRIICISYAFFGFTCAYYSTMRSVEVVKVAVISNVVALVVNASLNYILIFGKFGAPAMGVKGAALATLIARLCEFLIAFIHMVFIDKRLKLKFKDFVKFDKIMFSDMIKVATPVVLNESMWALGTSMQAALLGKLGTHVVAANSIISVIQQLSTVAVFGVANAAAVSIGKAIGEGDMQKARDRGHTFKVISLIFGVFVTIVIILCKDIAIDFYNVTPQAKELAHQLIYVAAVIGFFVSIAGISIVGILRGGGDAKFAFYAEFLSLWLVAVPLAYFCAFVLKFPPILVFAVMKIDEPVKVVLCLIRMKGTKWINDVTR